MKPDQQWNEAGYCFMNASILRKVGMPVAADAWERRGNELIAKQTAPFNSFVDELMGLKK